MKWGSNGLEGIAAWGSILSKLTVGQNVALSGGQWTFAAIVCNGILISSLQPFPGADRIFALPL